MKKTIALSIALLMAMFLTACGSSGGDSTSPPDLLGEWKQVNSKSEDTWQAATITEDTIEVYWVTDGGETTMLYWAGTFSKPDSAAEPYSWESENDHEKTDFSLMASEDDTKTFTYEKGQISYSVSAFGATTTVKLEKE